MAWDGGALESNREEAGVPWHALATVVWRWKILRGNKQSEGFQNTTTSVVDTNSSEISISISIAQQKMILNILFYFKC